MNIVNTLEQTNDNDMDLLRNFVLCMDGLMTSDHTNKETIVRVIVHTQFSDRQG